MAYLLKGLILGFSIAAAIGPIALLCIRRTLAHSRMTGFVSGIGAATADAIYGSVAAFGLTAVSSVLLKYKLEIRIIGGLFLVYLAAKIFFAKPSEAAKSNDSRNLTSSYLSTLFLTLTNPMTIIYFLAVFAGLGIGTSTNSYKEAFAMVIGVFSGSAILYLLLSWFVGLFKDKISSKGLLWMNKISAVLILILATIAFK